MTPDDGDDDDDDDDDDNNDDNDDDEMSILRMRPFPGFSAPQLHRFCNGEWAVWYN